MPNPLFTHRCARCLLPFTQPSLTGNCPGCLGAVLPHVEACSAYRAANPHLVLAANFDPYDGPGTVALGADQLVVPCVAIPSRPHMEDQIGRYTILEEDFGPLSLCQYDGPSSEALRQEAKSRAFGVQYGAHSSLAQDEDHGE